MIGDRRKTGMYTRRIIAHRLYRVRRILGSGIAMILAIALNILLIRLNLLFDSPLYLNTIGSFSVTLLYGVVPALFTAFFTHLIGALFFSWQVAFFPFLFSHLVVLVLFYVLLRRNNFVTVVDVVIAVAIIAFANTLTSSIIAALLYHGISGHSSDYLIIGFMSAGVGPFWAGFWGRFPINLVDKGLTLFLVYGLKRMIESGRDREKKDILP